MNIKNQKTGTRAKRVKSKLKFIVAREEGPVGNWAVKYKRYGVWFTAADTFCIDDFKDAKEMAGVIARALNSVVKG